MSDDGGRDAEPGASSELRPARPDAASTEGGASYMPRIPWGWILLGTAALVALFGGYYVRRQQRADALRQQMLTLHEERLADVAERYAAFRARIEGLVQHAASAGEPEAWADPRLRISGLRAGDGLYLRLTPEDAADPERIARAALSMPPDSITRCLGIAPMSLSGLYEKGEFLTPQWVENLRGEEDMMELRVLDDQLGRHVQVDVPVILTMIQADWFLLVIQRGENRRDHPVDVFLWDLRRGDQELLRARIQGRGLLVPVRLSFEGVAPGAPPPGGTPQSGAAQDCSIASQIRGLAGEEPVDFESGARLIERVDGEAGAAPEPGPAAPREPGEPREPQPESEASGEPDP